MSYQKCPICNGTGKINTYGLSTLTMEICDTCNGTKIIDDITGLPPSRNFVKSSTNTTDFKMTNNASGELIVKPIIDKEDDSYLFNAT